VKVIRASAMGMCFGVKDALQAARAIEQPRRTTIYGELVHNPEVARELAERGFKSLPEATRNAIPHGEQVLITAHGVSDRARRDLRMSGHELIDTTCPLVQRAHLAAKRLQVNGYFVVVVGKPQHVEVIGLTGDLTDFAVVNSPGDAAHYGRAKIGVVCQTTTPPDHAREVLVAIKRLNPEAEIRVEDTICRPTRERQLAMAELLPQVDAVVVVGGAHSNNTRQLVGLAQSLGVPVCHVQCAAELNAQWFAGMQTVGLTAGTSTLDETIDEVEFVLEAVEAGCF
jgi:4-hydroxy-3-methylbut-2-enyl diphosphate reductase